ncbi:MAG: SHOCT domain-containing protein [Fimbriimonadaceae bacterium]|nr:SHOCT domain-containing protein [Fimbriimonadaceae bacterium]
MLPVTIEVFHAAASPPLNSHGLRVEAHQLSEQLLAARPEEYAVVAETANALVALAATLLPALQPQVAGSIAADALCELLGTALERVVLDKNWEHRLADRLASEQPRQRRLNLVALLREEPSEEATQAALAAAVAEVRQRLLEPAQLAACLRDLAADGLLAHCPEPPEAFRLPGAARAVEPFHGSVLRDALLAHLAEVRSWALPAANPADAVRQALEHGRLLTPGTPAGNSMLRGAVRERLEQRLTELLAPTDGRTEQLQRLLLAPLDLPRTAAGRPDPYRLAEQLLPAVLQPDNVQAVLELLAAAGDLTPPEAGRPEYADPGWAPPRPAGGPPTPPPAVHSLVDPESIKARLRLLRELHQEGLISDAEYADRRQLILDLL